MDPTQQFDLSALLSDSGAHLAAKEIPDLIAGVLGAPGDDGGNGQTNSWMTMVAENPSKKLDQCLHALLAAARELEETGLTTPCPCNARVSLLRNELALRKLDGFVVPHADEHQGEYLPKHSQRLTWLTGFTGSAGVAVILKNKAAVFVDGRYTLQAAAQLDEDVFEIVRLTDSSPGNWITLNIRQDELLGYDPWLHTASGVNRLEVGTTHARAKLVAVDTNPIDTIWDNQPASPLSPIKTQNTQFTGQSSAEKRRAISETLKDAGQDAVVLTAPDSIAWLANLRGGDVPYTPFALAFGILHVDTKFDLFIDLRKASPSVAQTLKNDVSLRPIDEFSLALDDLGREAAKVRVDPHGVAKAIHSRLTEAGAILATEDDPCSLPKGCKNETELEGIRAAHRRDGFALTRFLAWLAREAPGGNVTEISAADRLEAFRREGKFIRGLSFPTISGAGPNGAIIHYRATEASNRFLEMNSLYLVDSGAQYLDGTTDVTRTVAIGKPNEEMRDRFTRVLKGHIALATTVFPEGTTGSQLDVLARAPLWQVGLDYDHGTGHGVGHYLGVHEGPHRISKIPNRVPLKPGMVVSNEPGYYKDGAYGIRIENLSVITTIEEKAGSERELLGLETLTLAPIDLNLVDKSLLTEHEVAWLNSYHSLVLETHAATLHQRDRKWLEQATHSI